MLGKLLLITAAAIGGIYLTSPEGKNARIALLRRKAALEPIMRDLLAQAQAVLEGSKQINSDEVRANINFLVNEVKATLIDIDFDKTLNAMREAFKVAARKLEEAKQELASAPLISTKTALTSELKREARKVSRKVQSGVAKKVAPRSANKQVAQRTSAPRKD